MKKSRAILLTSKLKEGTRHDELQHTKYMLLLYGAESSIPICHAYY